MDKVPCAAPISLPETGASNVESPRFAPSKYIFCDNLGLVVVISII